MRDSLVCIKELQNWGYLRSDCVASNLTAMNTHKRSDHIYTRTWADISPRLQTLGIGDYVFRFILLNCLSGYCQNCLKYPTTFQGPKGQRYECCEWFRLGLWLIWFITMLFFLFFLVFGRGWGQSQGHISVTTTVAGGSSYNTSWTTL